MKIRIISALVLILAVSKGAEVYSQTTYKIKTGTKITYAAADPGANISLPVTITVPSSGGAIMTYTVKQAQKSFTGKIVISKTGLQSAASMSWGDLSPDEKRVLNDSETAFCFSRSFYSKLVKNKSAVYDGVNFTLQNIPKENKMKVGSRTFDVLYITGQNGTKYWILKDSKYPLLMKVSGNQSGPDLVVSAASGL